MEWFGHLITIPEEFNYDTVEEVMDFMNTQIQGGKAQLRQNVHYSCE